MDTDVLKGFAALDPAKAAAVLPEFRKHIKQLQELHVRKNQLLQQLVFHVALKAQGHESRDVQSYIYEHVFRRHKWDTSGAGNHSSEMVDAIDWKTGQPKLTTSVRKTDRIAGVILKPTEGNEHLPGRIIKFDEPIDSWK